MNRKFIVAILLVTAVPALAQAQKPSAAKVTKADAQKVLEIIGRDKAKTQAYCDMAKLGDQMEQANEKRDSKKFDELSLKMDELAKKLGPEYAALMDGLPDIEPGSEDGKEIESALSGLDRLCTR
jgi:peptidoglycan hydrolase CwlO-like protein